MSATPAMRRSTGGFTLLELLISLTVSILTIGAAMTLLIQQQQTYTSTSEDRAAQEAGAQALKEMVARLRLAGYGVDPNLTFDFGALTQPVPREGLPTGAVAHTSFKCGVAVACRDKSDGSDEIVFYARNPLFSRPITAFGPTSLTVKGSLTRPIYQGQILQPMCLGEDQLRGYVTVSRTVLPSGLNDPNEVVTIQLDAGVVVGSVYQFPNENGIYTNTCWGVTAAGTAPVVAQVDRYRFYVAWYDAAGAKVAAQTPGSRPYLMLDQGLTDQSGNAIVIPVAADVEDLQLSYYYPTAVAGGPPRVVAATPGVTANADPVLPISVTDVAPDYLDAPSAPSRLTGNPANIRAVKVSVVVRGAAYDLTSAAGGMHTLLDVPLPAMGNRPQVNGDPGYRRSMFETTVLLRNQQSTAFSYCVFDPAAAPGTGVNRGGC